MTKFSYHLTLFGYQCIICLDLIFVGSFMKNTRNRVSITLTDSEMEQVKALSKILGVKPTRVVYEALKEGMPLILRKNQEGAGLLATSTAISALTGAALGGGALAAGGVGASLGALVAGSAIGTTVVNVADIKNKFYNLIDTIFTESSKENQVK